MATITIEFNAPELAEAIYNLAKAQTAVAEAYGRLASVWNFPGGSGYRLAPPRVPELPPVAGALPAGAPAQPEGPPYPYPVPLKTPALPAGPVKSGQVPEAKALPEHSFTLDDLAKAAASLMGAGKYMLLVELLGKFGVQALFQLPKEYFGAFAAALRQLGAQI